jgi:hypothetical protein
MLGKITTNLGYIPMQFPSIILSIVRSKPVSGWDEQSNPQAKPKKIVLDESSHLITRSAAS